GQGALTQSRIRGHRDPHFGLFEGGVLAAVSGTLVMGKALAYFGVLVHPLRRGRGLARNVLTAAAEAAFKNGLVPFWRAAATNKPALALGHSLGFRPYAEVRVVELVECEF